MDQEIADMLKKQDEKIDHLTYLFTAFLNKKATEDGWYDPVDTMEKLKIRERSLYRLRYKFPEQCRKLMGTWYYNVPELIIFKGTKPKVPN